MVSFLVDIVRVKVDLNVNVHNSGLLLLFLRRDDTENVVSDVTFSVNNLAPSLTDLKCKLIIRYYNANRYTETLN